MLIKKDLLKIPSCDFQPVEETKDRYSTNYEYTAAAKVVKLPKCGKVLVAEIFSTADKQLKLRFFSDGKNFINYMPEKDEWNNRKPSLALYEWRYCNVYSSEAGKELVAKTINKHHANKYGNGIMDELERFAERIYEKQTRKAYEHKYELLKQHFAMYPKFPQNLQAYCEKHVFNHTYIFIGKVNKNSRTAVCGNCGHEFTVPHTVRHKSEGQCPRCKKKAIYYGNWYPQTINEKAKICICHKSEGNLIIRWADVMRFYENYQVKYSFSDYYYNLYLRRNGKPEIYSYRYMSVMQCGWDWFRKRNGDVNHDAAYLYTTNLRQVFGRDYYHLDLGATLNKCERPIDFVGLLDNLEDYPVTEYLVRLGLYNLASGYAPKELTGKGFADVLGVSKQYLPLYQKYDVTRQEHNLIKSSRTWVSMESFEKLRKLNIKYRAGEVTDLLQEMSFERFVNYFTKQKALYPKREIDELIVWYRDYISMSESLRVNLSNKSVCFPSDIKAAHDRILIRVTLVKNRDLDKQFKKEAPKLYAGLKDYQTDKFKIVLPQSRSDFIVEGQSLNHCVGKFDSYFQNHLKGERMIFFIRHTAEPDKPYFTMELDMKRLIILQLYGFGDCTAPAEVRKFANEFLKRLKPGKTAAA